MNEKIVVLADNLMFTSKIDAAIRSLGASSQITQSATQALEMCNREPISLALVDLNATRCHPEEFLAGAKSLNIPVIAFVSHVDADLIARARQIGCGQILARSAFFNNLPQVIKSFVATDLKPVD